MSTVASIRFVRNLNSKAQDDLIVLRANGNNVDVTHTEGLDKKKFQLVLTETSLSRYIDTMLRLARNDTEPFAAVQVNLPGFPSFLFTTPRLQNSEVLRALREAAWTVQDSWTRHLPAGDAASEASTESYSSSESEDESESDASSTDSDMPPLIPPTPDLPLSGAPEHGAPTPRRRSPRLHVTLTPSQRIVSYSTQE